MINIPKQLQKEEFRFLLIQDKKKEPIEPNWQSINNYKFNDGRLLDHIREGGNYGIIGGYDNLIIIDSDSIEVETIAKTLTLTFTVKTGSEEEYKKHYFFKADKKIKPIRLSKAKVGDLGDIRSVGQYVVGANCIHPSGGIYKVIKDLPIEKITEKEIRESFKDLIDVKASTEFKEFKQDTTKRENPYIKSCKVPDFLLSNKLKGNTSKNWELFRYVVDICYNRGVSEDYIFQICKNQQHSIGAIKGWIDLVKKGKLEKSSCEKLRYYLGHFHLECIKDICDDCIVLKSSKESLTIKLDNYMENVGLFWKKKPFFYDESNMFWVWDLMEKRYKMADDTTMMLLIDNSLGLEGQTVNTRIKSNYIEAFKRVGRRHEPKPAPKKWIQFKDKAFSLKSKKFYDVLPNFFFTNPIPWELGKNEDTPTMDKLITEWVGEKYKETVYQIIAYCCLNDYPIHLIFCLVGCGRNGKTTFLRLLNKFIGKENVCSTELDILLDSRFESFKLYKKLVCMMGETNFGIMNKTSLLKRLTGQDLIGFEFKNKKPFDDYNYAKIMISSNSLPTTEDTSEGFYRRWFIVDFSNTFPEGKDILKNVPDIEYNNLCKKVIRILPNLLESTKFTNQGTIAERKMRYVVSSNPLPLFISLCCNVFSSAFVSYNELYTNYIKLLKVLKKRRISRKEFKIALEDEGFWIEKSAKSIGGEWKSGLYIDGLDINLEKLDFFTNNPTQFSILGNQVEKVVKKSKSSEIEEPIDTEELVPPTITHCEVCGTSPCTFYTLGKYFCSKDCILAYKPNTVVKK